jgi:hypothetical protein
MTAINIPDMYQIVKEHGLIPVPFDFDLETMHPKGVEEFKTLINDNVYIYYAC